MYFVGVDLGQRRDHSAIVAVERMGHFAVGQNGPQEFHVRFAERMALGTPYPRVVERVGAVTRSAALTGRCVVVVDATGVGAPVVDLLRAARLGCDVVAVTITGGDRERNLGRVWSVPKQNLIGGVQTSLEKGELRIAAGLREREALRRELLDVETREGAGGRMRIGAEGAGEHDDLVMALALGCWRAKWKQVGYATTGRLVW